jgi:hypothetical protein
MTVRSSVFIRVHPWPISVFLATARPIANPTARKPSLSALCPLCALSIFLSFPLRLSVSAVNPR